MQNVTVTVELNGKKLIIQGHIVGQVKEPAQVQPLRSHPSTSRQAAKAQVPSSPQGNGQGQICPTHGAAKASKYNGFFCPTRVEGGSWCSWRWPPPKNQAA